MKIRTIVIAFFLFSLSASCATIVGEPNSVITYY